MKLTELQIKESDFSRLNRIKSLIVDIYGLGHDEHFEELGEELEYFIAHYPKNILSDILESDEIAEQINNSILFK